jgi:two-component system KDP operon response regulator KdpE
MGRIIVASPNARQRRDLRIGLECQGHSVAEAISAEQTIEEALACIYDVLILDSRIDGLDLYSFCRAIRPHSDLGIIILLREGEEQSRIDALNAGADDYLPERFAVDELLARVRAILRRIRSFGDTRTRITLHDRAIDLSSRKVEGPGNRVAALTPKEFLVLKVLLDSSDKPVTNRDLARAVWEREESSDFEYLRTIVSQLRRKLERDHTRPQYLLTERAVGYQFRVPAVERLAPARENAVYPYKSDSRAMAL